jgi:hypothetical protein
VTKDVEALDDFYHYNPFGKGGGGAPLRDQHGNVITTRKPQYRASMDRQHHKRPKEISVAARLKRNGRGGTAWGGKGEEMKYDYHVEEQEPAPVGDF